MSVDEQVLDARRAAGTVVPDTLRQVMAKRWGRVRPTDLSRASGVPTSTARNHILGKNAIPSDDLAAYAAALGIPPWLLFRPADEALAWMREKGLDPSQVRGAYLTSAA